MTDEHHDLLMSGSAEIHIAASPEVLYEMVSDVTRMGEWSPETVACRWVDGDRPVVGARFEGDNRSSTGAGPWTMVATVTDAEPGKEFGFVTGKPEGPATHWRYAFRPETGGTRVVESFSWSWLPSRSGFRGEVGAAPIEQAREMVAGRQEQLIANMASTLERLKAAAES